MQASSPKKVEQIHSAGSSTLNVNSCVAYGACTLTTNDDNNGYTSNELEPGTSSPSRSPSCSRSRSRSITTIPRNNVLQQQQQQQQQQECTIQKPSEESALRGRRRKNPFLASCLRRLESFNPCLVLENNGSVARDHLAAERTFLAYVRTSLVCATMGVTLVQLLSLTSHSMPPRLQALGQYLGAIAELFGILIMIIAVSRYFAMQRSLIEGKYRPAGMIIWALSFGMGALILIIFGLLIGIAISR